MDESKKAKDEVRRRLRRRVLAWVLALVSAAGGWAAGEVADVFDDDVECVEVEFDD